MRLSYSTINKTGDEIAILGRILSNGKELSRALARHVLSLAFSEEDNARINQLAERNQLGTISRQELDELQGYAKAGCLLGVLHLKARRALRKSGTKNTRVRS